MLGHCGVALLLLHPSSPSSHSWALALRCTSKGQAFVAVRDQLLGGQQQQLAAAAVSAAAAAAGPTPAGRQGGLTLTSMLAGLQRMNKEVDNKVAAFFYANGISFYASRSLEFREMVDAIAARCFIHRPKV